MTKLQSFIQLLQEKKQYLIIIFVVSLGIIYFFVNQKEDEITETTFSNLQTELQGESDELIDAANKTNEPVQPVLEDIKVDVKGAVKSPGVYPAKSNERVIDIIERAGSLLETADGTKVNLSQKVMDEMVIYIPEIGADPVELSQFSPSGQNQSQGDGKVNINKADANALQTLPGIGPSKADAIIEYRETNGSFQTVEDLLNISGIGEKTFEKLKDLITVQ